MEKDRPERSTAVEPVLRQQERRGIARVFTLIALLSAIVLLAAFAIVYTFEPAGGVTPPSPRAAPGSAAVRTAG